MICARCDKLIKGEPMEINVDTGTGAAATVYVCAELCPRPGRRLLRTP
ncbi:hypothetical protein ABTZ78_31160 [Streptomyces bauhiniae]